MTGVSLHTRFELLAGSWVGPGAAAGQLTHGFERNGVERFLSHVFEDGQISERGEIQIVGTDRQRASKQEQSQKVFQVFTVEF